MNLWRQAVNWHTVLLLGALALYLSGAEWWVLAAAIIVSASGWVVEEAGKRKPHARREEKMHYNGDHNGDDGDGDGDGN